METRELRQEDLPDLKRIIEGNGNKFDLPEFNNVVADAVVINHGKLAGYGMSRIFCEALIVLDQDLSNFEKAKAIKTLFQSCIDTCTNAGLDEMNVFVEDPNYANFLIKHFGFKRYTGIALVKDLDNGKAKEE